GHRRDADADRPRDDLPRVAVRIVAEEDGVERQASRHEGQARGERSGDQDVRGRGGAAVGESDLELERCPRGGADPGDAFDGLQRWLARDGWIAEHGPASYHVSNRPG